MARYLLSVYTPTDGTPPTPEELETIMKNVEGFHQELRDAGAWVFAGGLEAPDTATARTRLMERAWPAKDVGPLVALIADPRHLVMADNTIRLTEEQAKAILELRLQRLTALGIAEIA